MSTPRVFVDFHNADTQGRVRLNCVGAARDLADQQVRLREGLVLTFYSEDLEVQGVVQRSAEEGLWVGEIDWQALRPSGTTVAGGDHHLS